MASTYPPVEIPATWQGPGIDYTQHGLHLLSAGEQAEIDAALAHLHGCGDLDFPAISPETFPLPRLGPRLAALRQELATGSGFVLLRGLPRERYDIDDLARIYYGLGVHIGLPTPQSWQGELLGNVIDVSDIEPRVRGYHAGGAQRMHADSCDVVALMCLRAARQGGASRIVSAVAIHNWLVTHRPDLAAALYAGFTYRRMELDAQHGTGVLVSRRPIAMFARHGGAFSCYLSGFYARRAASHGDSALSPLQTEALETVERLAASPEFYLDMQIGEGDIQFLNNRLLLHGRTDYEDDPDVTRRRHMLRLWLRIPDWPELADDQRVHTPDDHRLWLRQRRPTMEFPARYLAEMSRRQQSRVA